ncbi:MAG: Uma2 family endonuclease [Polyangiaceae bacterium]|nr:Uma2 family endonuclease [Polyangiaceae bacterium]
MQPPSDLTCGWTLDPDDPRAPSQEQWDRMSPEQRARVVATLPSEFPPSEAHPPPEGDPHIDAWTLPRQTLRRWSKRGGRRMYVGGNMAIYYPDERMFSPDLFAVLDVPDHNRDSWIVVHEGRGLDLCLEVVVASRRRKDFQDNVKRYARLGISEYFILDWRMHTLLGYRLPPESRSVGYQRLVAQAGRLSSAVLGLELFMDGARLKFALGDAILPDSDELVRRLEGLVTEAVQRAEQIEAQLLEEQRQREQEQRRREALEREVAELRHELAELRERK